MSTAVCTTRRMLDRLGLEAVAPQAGALLIGSRAICSTWGAEHGQFEIAAFTDRRRGATISASSLPTLALMATSQNDATLAWTSLSSSTIRSNNFALLAGVINT